jgi:hypothetical protein
MEICISGPQSPTEVAKELMTNIRDRFRLDTHGYEFGCHYLPHFISNADTNTNIIKYECKTDISNSDSHSNTYSIYSIES